MKTAGLPPFIAHPNHLTLINLSSSTLIHLDFYFLLLLGIFTSNFNAASMMDNCYSKINFLNIEKSEFYSTLRSKIDVYFKSNNINKNGNYSLILKATCMLSIYLIPFGLILFTEVSFLQMLFLSFLMGIGVAGVGMSVMHDAIHGSFSSSSLVNKIFSSSLYLLGGNVYNWKIQHNRLHHTYTNIHNIDEDITGKFLLRLSRDTALKKIHRFQHYYAFLLYSLMTFSFLWKDFKEIPLYNKMSASGLVPAFSFKEIIVLIVSKIFYLLLIVVLPLLFTDLPFLQWLAGFLVMHFTAGIILSTIFQLAHVVEGAEQPITDQNGNIENAWAIHQLNTTANFSGKNKLLSWYIGGLDYQIEHHLFPSISHVHYPAVANIVHKTASEFGLTYNNKGSFYAGLRSHVNMLYQLGNGLT